MTNFRTILPSSAFDFSITHQDYILSVGSCFAEHIGNRLGQYKFANCLNPFGILYNPTSIAAGLELLLSGEKLDTSDVFYDQGLWHSFRHHGAFSHPDQAIMLQQVNEQAQTAKAFLEKTTCLIITLGTANTYVHKESDEVVANCHKLPAAHFYRKMLDPVDIAERLGSVLEQVKAENPGLNVLLTVSPVRHIRDGIIENNQSKARLLLATAQLSKQMEWIHYFPSYELLMDDLRDYRFYKEDMVHPSDLAIDYVWDYFANAFFSEVTRKLMQQIEKLFRASKHRPFHIESAAHQAFLTKQLEKLEHLETAHPFLDFAVERRIFESQRIP